MIGTILLWLLFGVLLVLWILGAVIGFIGEHFWWFLLAAMIVGIITVSRKDKRK